MKVISVINYKGGVGKTTVTSNIATQLGVLGKKVLVIDLDPQTNLTFSYLKVDEWKDKYEKDKTIKYWFDSIIDCKNPMPTLKSLIVKDNNVDIICSHLGLIDVDIELAAGLSAGTDRQHKKNFIKTYSYIKNELKSLKDEYDIVLIDCPPNFSIVTKNALIASDFYMVPAKMDYLSTLGINQLRNHVNKIVIQYNTYCKETEDKPCNPSMLGVIGTMISIRNNEPISTQKYYIDTLIRNDIPLFNSKIRENKTIYPYASENQTQVVLQSNNTGTYGEIVKELKDLTEEFMVKVGI